MPWRQGPDWASSNAQLCRAALLRLACGRLDYSSALLLLLLLLPLLLQDIQRLLKPDAAGVRAELYCLNIYGPGGFFRNHVDTPHASSMFGSLVICLPTDFTGGAPGVLQWGSIAALLILRQLASCQMHNASTEVGRSRCDTQDGPGRLQLQD